MNKKPVLRPGLWTPRPVEETIAVYAEWADTYDAEVTARGYRTPERLAAALAQFADPSAAILDFGCGTGISGIALRQAGFTTMDGTDITKEMLAKAANSGIYRKTWVSSPDDMGFDPETYDVIVAVGVISLGAAPASLLDQLLKMLPPKGLLALSYNDPTLADETYTKAMDDVVANGNATLLFRDHGPHLEDVGMESDVIVLQRT